jgi:hypothetical protein
MGVGPITWGELQAWQVQTGVDLQPWEARTVHRLSRDFAGETRRAEDPAAAAPMRPVMTEDRRASVADKIRQQYRVRLILDNLPITTYVLELDPESGG